MRLHPRLRIDLPPAQILAAVARCVLPIGEAEEARRVEAFWPSSLFTLSVRSALDLALTAMAPPPGSEVIFSGVTIPDMAEIARAHGLSVVAVDLDLATLAPPAETLERAITVRTCAVVIAHLYGGRIDLGAIAELCERRGVPLLEDCAQAFCSPNDSGSANALVSLFSFGPLKTCTALGGGVAVVRDVKLLDRMRQVQATWPAQSRGAFALRALKYFMLSALQNARVFYVFTKLVAAAGADLNALLSASVKSFARGQDAMLRGIRRRPCAALGRTLALRLATFDGARLRRRTQIGERLRAALVKTSHLPGAAQPTRTHWLFPVAADDPTALLAGLRAEGFDAAQGTTSLVALEGEVPEVRRMLRSIVYLPAYPELPDAEIERLIDAVKRAMAQDRDAVNALAAEPEVARGCLEET